MRLHDLESMAMTWALQSNSAGLILRPKEPNILARLSTVRFLAWQARQVPFAPDFVDFPRIVSKRIPRCLRGIVVAFLSKQ